MPVFKRLSISKSRNSKSSISPNFLNKGFNTKFDKRGNYTFGISEQIIFPEIEVDKVNTMLGMDITIVTTAKTDEEGFALLKEFGFPFKK